MSQRRNSKNQTPESESVSRRAQRRIEQERRQRRQRLLMVGGAVVLAVVIVGALILLNRPDDDGDDASALGVTPPSTSVDASIPQEGRTLGNPDAPLTIVEYADFQCPACGNFARTVKPQLIEDYIATGQAKLEFHDFPFLDNRSDTSESDDASEAAFCAQDQGQFWAYHDTLFSNQSGENEGAFARDRLIEMARTIEGLDVDQFTSCIDGDEFEDDVQTMYDQAVAAGINSTPTFVLDGQTVRGSGYAELQAAIEAALAN